ncbi:YggS family pyridoxal phosphate enzyme [Oleiphilus sp. HI0071]|jgi:pyridoxal phosphate enzyme (YggS family)|uniref:YggS family pyridoxal phosphate-dependent enzyme n=1 Tax=unclassified Oleiphilus TaxID=2631174 RepID=UPI0007C24CBA|nr:MULTISPECIES: YggS family pyridoxal phosphate-dependent enzyme [unclassified Oleiphilus]KZY68205.1 YggS family pyridoxal phosphate enzyme [Oleiphilus sp. HI0065]KZY79907.1 YggS family pyridoxal phosphate enzyme [Oleiphilus sp. HI0071]KZZ06275.1 YggS family pyridoxal phosphate enzyme [Oleiphilus sp. HI0073]KZZ42977.1 YggS family pyridoxal phosphate enzyme [Oleiphilus sp. HI0118]KZZ49970.1 YggS family pyridoxal phosphate enzyme [Oleiphilus sp. HI0122]KZZ65292.1 YggS family pyridoxal phosphat
MFRIADKLENVRLRIKKATISAGRLTDEVELLPVSKKHSAESVLEAFDAGCRAFGENYVSEAVEKQQQLAVLDSDKAAEISWYFIGPVQSNKTRLIAEHFDWVQSLDRLKIAQRLNDQRPKELGPLNICIQVNIDNEESKSGLSVDEIERFAESISHFPNLRLRGLMAIPSAHSDDQTLSASMAKLQQAFLVLKAEYESVDTLSMGMSSDIELAIKNGSTMVRVGTAIFGARTSTE